MRKLGAIIAIVGILAICASAHAGVTTRVSVASDGTQGNDWNSWPSISADGRYVAFDSCASNLVPGDTNGFFDEYGDWFPYGDVFVHDRQAGMLSGWREVIGKPLFAVTLAASSMLILGT